MGPGIFQLWQCPSFKEVPLLPGRAKFTHARQLTILFKHLWPLNLGQREATSNSIGSLTRHASRRCAMVCLGCLGVLDCEWCVINLLGMHHTCGASFARPAECLLPLRGIIRSADASRNECMNPGGCTTQRIPSGCGKSLQMPPTSACSCTTNASGVFVLTGLTDGLVSCNHLTFNLSPRGRSWGRPWRTSK